MAQIIPRMGGRFPRKSRIISSRSCRAFPPRQACTHQSTKYCGRQKKEANIGGRNISNTPMCQEISVRNIHGDISTRSIWWNNDSNRITSE